VSQLRAITRGMVGDGRMGSEENGEENEVNPVRFISVAYAMLRNFESAQLPNPTHHQF
jgi:hypothetical protein